MPKTINKYDASYKKLFANQEIVASLLQGFAPPGILADMDLSTLEPLPAEHITRDNKERRNDLLWQVKYGDALCYLIIMLEFQSNEDWWMAVRVSEYSALLLWDVIKYGKFNKNDKLPFIFPFVIYNGNKKWQAPEEISQLFSGYNKNIDSYQPHQKYYLLDIKHLSKLYENADDNLSMQIFNLENSSSIQDIANIIKNLAKMLPEDEKSYIHEAFINLLSVNIIEDPKLGSHIYNCKTVQEAYIMLADDAPLWKRNLLEEGFVKGEQKGREEGFVQGDENGELRGVKKSLQTILNTRFGTLSKELLAAIDKITDVNILQFLVSEAVSTENLDKFIGKINHKVD